MTILTTDTKKLYEITLEHRFENGNYMGRRNYIDDFYDEHAFDTEKDDMGCFLMTDAEFSELCAKWEAECSTVNAGKDGEELDALNKWQILRGEYWEFDAHCIGENVEPEYFDEEE